MALVWIKCITIVRAADDHGVIQSYHPGDWCQVGKHQARLLVASGCAEIQNPVTRAQTFELTDCGVVAHGHNRLAAATAVGNALPELRVHTDGQPRIAFNRTLIYNPEVKINAALLPVGFHRLTTGWRIAAPIIPSTGTDYLTANMIGTEEDRAATKAIVRDLRCPVYDPRIIFVLQAADCEALIDQWLDESAVPGNDERLAFLRAWYTHKPQMCGLPASWYGR